MCIKIYATRSECYFGVGLGSAPLAWPQLFVDGEEERGRERGGREGERIVRDEGEGGRERE